LKKDEVGLTGSVPNPVPDRHMGVFQTEYHYLSNSHPSLGSIATLHWDEAVFGFPVSDLRIGGEPPAIADIPLLREALLGYCERTRSELVSVRVPAPQTLMSSVLSRAGFVYADFALRATLTKLDDTSLRKTALTVRRAEAADHGAICHISENAFHFGRYHTDPYFPRELANRRYVQWIKRALSGLDPDDAVFVLGGPGKVIGFMHVALHDGSADLRLGAVTQGSSLGFWLYNETLRAVHALGARSVSTGISAANVRVMQIYSALGFRFTHPELILHWHSPQAAHLNPELCLVELQ
jgi:hypothetical protein